MDTNKYNLAMCNYINNPSITLRKIVEIYHVDRPKLVRLLKAKNIEIRKRHASPVSIKNAVKEYASCKDLNLEKISRKYKMTKDTLRKALKEAGIKIRNRYYNFDERFFQTIDSEEKAYWLGFYCADGHTSKELRSISIELARRDKNHLVKFANIFNLPVKLRTIKHNKSGKIYKKAYISISSRSIVKDILNLCIPQQKTKLMTCGIFNKIPKHLVNHFVRGYFDGDGGIYNADKDGQYSFSICGTYTFLQKLSKIITENCKINYHSPKIFANVSKIFIHGNSQLIKVKKWMYKNATTYLERKKEVFDSI